MRAEPLDASNRAGEGLTVHQVARRYRVGESKVRAWIARGELKAINTAAALCGRPRWVIPVEALAEFEKGRFRRAGAKATTPTSAHRERN